MPTPKEILSIPRPVNSYVRPYGKDKDRYEVVAKAGCTYTNAKGKSITVARSGRVIGHIIDNEFKPISDQTLRLGKLIQTEIGRKTWADVELCIKLGQDLLDQLLAVFNYEDAYAIFSIGIARVCRPGIINDCLYQEFTESMLSEHYKFVGLCPNSVCVLLNNLGKCTGLIDEFFNNRVKQMVIYEDGTPKSSVIVDGTLVTNYSKINSFADFSYKARQKGATEFNLLIALSVDHNEPVCLGLYRGNQTDTVNCQDFLEKNCIVEGFLVIDKGFSITRLAGYLAEHPLLHYLKPLNRNGGIIKKYNLYSYEKPLDFNDHILGRKVKCDDEDTYISGRKKYLYSFQDLDRASIERIGWVARTNKNNNFSHEAMRMEEEEFGTIVFESDVDMKLEDAYLLYRRRWGIETMMEFYKDSNDLNDTRVHDDYSLIGSEFCNFIAMVLTYKILNYLDSKDLRNNCTYKRIMSMLGSTHKRRVKKGDGKDDWVLEPCTKRVAELLDSLDLITEKERKQLFPSKVGRPIEYVDYEEMDSATGEPNQTSANRKKPGRPKGSKNKPKTGDNETSESKPKRGAGRPKGSKNKPKTGDNETSESKPKRGAGRPKGSKNKKSLGHTVEGSVINPNPVTTVAANPNTETMEETTLTTVTKRGPGRPKGSKNKPKNAEGESNDQPKIKRGPGRPKGSKNKDKSTDNKDNDPVAPKSKSGSTKEPKDKMNPDSKDKDIVSKTQSDNPEDKNEQSKGISSATGRVTQKSQNDGIKDKANKEMGGGNQIFNKSLQIDAPDRETHRPTQKKDDGVLGGDDS